MVKLHHYEHRNIKKVWRTHAEVGVSQQLTLRTPGKEVYNRQFSAMLFPKE